MSVHFKPVSYHRPTDIREACRLLSTSGSRVIAGGTDLLVSKPTDTKNLIDINDLGLSYIIENEGTRIGAMVKFRDLADSDLLGRYPLKVLSDAALEVGHRNLRNLATVGGNICNAVPSADSPVALIALDASAVIRGETGERTFPLEDLFVFVRETALKPGEILKEIVIPKQPLSGASFQKLGRTKVDIALVNAACRVSVVDGLISDSRVVLGAVYPTPLRVREAEKVLDGKPFSEKTLDKAASMVAEAVKPISDHRASASYRLEMSQLLVKRALTEAYQRAEGTK